MKKVRPMNNIKITMISNYINHHQIPFSKALYKRLGDHYRFIQTEPMERERIQMGWSVNLDNHPYVVQLLEEEEYCKFLIEESDILLIGWNNREDLFEKRLSGNKLTIRISERIYREGQWKAISPRGLIKKYKEHIRYRNGNVHLLCAGAYVASDFSLIKAYPGKMYKFGYFPEFIPYTEEELRANHNWGTVRNERRIEIVWAGRFIELKYPHFPIKLAKSLKDKGYFFHLNMVGGGNMESQLKKMADDNRLQEYVTFHGFQRPEKVREIMEKSHIHLFTSNHLEGWGAVVNEAMNSGCVEVVNDQTGAAPFLIDHGKNGLMYKNGSYEDMEGQVIYLLDNPQRAAEISLSAYDTIAGQWNPEKAAERLFDFYEQWQNGKIIPPPEGPFSVAKIMHPGRGA